MRIAIVNEWLSVYAGSERVLEQLIKCFPEADLFAVCENLSDDDRFFLQGKAVKTTFIQKLPFSKSKYRNYLPLMPLAIEQLDLSSYDLIISSSHAVAKGVLTGPNQLHISYVHSPIRYAWDLQHQYLRESNLITGMKAFMVRYFLHRIRIWDYRTSFGVDYFISNSRFIGKRIKKIYGRTSDIIYPPVAVNDFELTEKKEDFYLTASRMVPYKKIDLIVEAFSKMPNKKLVVIGTGPDFDKIKKIATPNIELMGYQKFSKLKEMMQKAKAFVFAAEEDFGIAPVEAQACGTPIIAFGRGGALETIVDGRTGIFFSEQSCESLIDAISRFENNSSINPQDCRANAMRFSEERFRAEITEFVYKRYESFKSTI
ncbi:glycosyltransferase family 4 protein [Biostraticola tofi]|uniref:Glycosyltransferase involved in cell wall biosynthesis n=1 Tax=Biostraticola tofi TaxID=466109 RepID=A0A4V2W5K8_9GAMM|nr:glycosyltransferase family 4 protein [Biostraticola tofi]TCW00206.1 glycosyltransferase involved in cell wall biosynthesis [Biostraticola tofi]